MWSRIDGSTIFIGHPISVSFLSVHICAGDGTDQTCPIHGVYDDDDDDFWIHRHWYVVTCQRLSVVARY